MTETIKNRESLNLTPAESLMILDPKRSKGKEMLKLTLIDLLLKKVLKADVNYETVDRAFKRSKRSVKKINISEGENYSKANLKPHERMFAWDKLPSRNLELSKFAKEVYRNINKNFSFYKKHFVRYSLIVDGYFQKEIREFLFLFPYTKYALSEKGFSAQTKIKNLLEEGEKELEGWVKYEPARAKAYLSVCGTNILLLEHYHYDLQVIKEWIKELSNIESQENYSNYYPYSWHGWHELTSTNTLDDTINFDVSYFDSLDDFDSFDDFDTGFDGAGFDGGGFDGGGFDSGGFDGGGGE